MSSRAVVWLLVVGIVLFVIGRVLLSGDGNTGDAPDHIDALPEALVDANDVGNSSVDNVHPPDPVIGALATETEASDLGLGDGEPIANTVAAVEFEQAAVAPPTDTALSPLGSCSSWNRRTELPFPNGLMNSLRPAWMTTKSQLTMQR